MNLDITASGRWNFIFWACLMVVLLLSLMPPVSNMPTTGWDKTNHLLAFAFLFILGRQAYPGRNAAVLLGLLLYGGLIEVLQSFTPDHFAELGDLIADGLGLMIGWGLAVLFSESDRTDHSD
ncbi:MAG: hypothetical protein A3B82_05290 [Methylophilales bacterium RIFCSPHIGHO2_02_FULL_57_10]|nr:MAG: hypothetical protein A3B82_05290 [Methylophilales bacterium RIFCSPHIGHO2_02_FULL_57_10]